MILPRVNPLNSVSYGLQRRNKEFLFTLVLDNAEILRLLYYSIFRYHHMVQHKTHYTR
jgi:hypothetical protein